MVEALEGMKAAQVEEDRRLLYVAMTRAESWLIIAASGEVGGRGRDPSWYATVKDAMMALDGTEEFRAPTGEGGLRHSHGEWKSGSVSGASAEAGSEPEMPDWAARTAPKPEQPARPRAPSMLGGAKSLKAEDGRADREVLLQRGKMIHRLLEILPDISGADWKACSVRLLESEFSAAPDEAELAFEEARRVLETEELAFLFEDGALSEVEIWAKGPGLPPEGIMGVIDRLVVSPDAVLAVDFKTNAAVPSVPEQTPDGLLRQMGAYLAALEAVYPGRRVDIAILWTRTPALMRFSRETVRQALEGIAAS